VPVQYRIGRSQQPHLVLQQSYFAVARIVAKTLESLGMKFPEPTVNIKEIARKYHRAELEEEKNIGKSKRKQLTTEAKRDKGSKKDEKSKTQMAKKSARGKPAWEAGAVFGLARGRRAGGGRQFTLNSRERRANHETKSRRTLAPAAVSEPPSA
jgi:hypothetical protein